MQSIKDKTAIVGIGVTDFSKNSGRTELFLACECVKNAVDDAGLKMEDIDGMVKAVADPVDALYLQKCLGIDNLNYASDSHWGSSPMLNAVTAITAGIANYVLYYRSINGSSKRRMISDFRAALETRDNSLDMIRYDFYSPFGLITPEGLVAIIVRRYMHEFGIRSEQFGWVTTVCSEHAARNPRAIFYEKPITIDDYLKSDVAVEPLHALDCAPVVDGALAIIITSADRAKNLKKMPVYLMAVAQGTATEGQFLSSYSRPVMSSLPEVSYMGEELFRVAGVKPEDIDVVQLDDSYAPLVPLQLEELGFCRRGEGAAFCEGGDRIRVGGILPLNTSGGFIGEGHIYGSNIIEAVRQIRGTSTSQVDGAELALVASGAGGPADGLILRK
ncbi:MAG: lipid-transfer protein [Dehalococcoidia bacterium]|nr:MAG: lipid-transfer protein [Dehalococcoidia bacterium]